VHVPTPAYQWDRELRWFSSCEPTRLARAAACISSSAASASCTCTLAAPSAQGSPCAPHRVTSSLRHNNMRSECYRGLPSCL